MGLTAELTESIESIQKRALRIIFGVNSFTISSLHDKRDKLSTDFFPRNFSPVKLSPLSPPREPNT